VRHVFQRIGLTVVMGIMLVTGASARVDTLKDTSDIEDCLLYSYVNCDPEVTGEDCQRFNGGRVLNMGVGNGVCCDELRVVFKLPGWNDTISDSSELKVYCYLQSNFLSRQLIAYPLTRETFEGSENTHNLGDYPDPDSGATWLHAYLDVGAGDSVSWTSAGGDYTTAVACSVNITGTGQYYTMRNFNRMLTYWDTSGANYGFMLVNSNGVPVNLSRKVIKSSESGAGYYPLLLLYTADSTQVMRRSKTVRSLLRH
jgi:hypothetical protein